MKTVIKTELQQHLDKLRACQEAREWAGERTPQQAWDECERADWLLWWSAKAGADRKEVVLAACACASTALKYVKEGELRPLKAIETAEAWVRGEATLEEVRASSYAADAASYAAASSSYASYAADAAAAAADAASSYAAASSSYAAAAAADAAASSYAASSYAAARRASHVEMCKIVRGMLRCPKV